MPRPRAAAAALAILAATALGLPAPAASQDPDTVVVSGGVEEPVQEGVELPELDEPATPGGAFLRAVLLPGWGHASIGSYNRAGFYFTAEGATAFMLARTLRRLDAAKESRALREGRLLEELMTRGTTDPDSIAAILDQDEDVDDARDLVDARRQQLEDWLALGVFLVFLSGADAFVSAHLMDFPEPVEVGARVVPGPRGGMVEVGVRVPVGPPGRR